MSAILIGWQPDGKPILGGPDYDKVLATSQIIPHKALALVQAKLHRESTIILCDPTTAGNDMTLSLAAGSDNIGDVCTVVNYGHATRIVTITLVAATFVLKAESSISLVWTGASWSVGNFSDVMPNANTTSNTTIGYIVQVNLAVNTKATLPAGGTWEWVLNEIINASNLWVQTLVGVSAGASDVAPAVGANRYSGYFRKLR